MLLSTLVRSDRMDIVSTAPTVIQPGERLQVKVSVIPKEDCKLLELLWEVPKALTVLPASEMFPKQLAAGQLLEVQCGFLADPKREDFGEMRAHIKIELASGEETAVSWTAWISVFSRRRAENPDQLEDDLRQRLVDVVNARPRNGHIFLADYRGFFQDFLNVQIADHIAATLSEEFALPIEGLPLDPERRQMVIHGQMTFYGIERLELFAQGYCTESDDRFDAEEAREIKQEGDNYA